MFKYKLKKSGHGAFAAEVCFSHDQVVPMH